MNLGDKLTQIREENKNSNLKIEANVEFGEAKAKIDLDCNPMATALILSFLTKGK